MSSPITAGLNTFISKYFYHFRFHFFGWGALPPRPPDFGAGGAKPPRDPSLKLNGRSSHLIEAAKRGRLDQMIFFSAPLTTRAPPGRPGINSFRKGSLPKIHFSELWHLTASFVDSLVDVQCSASENLGFTDIVMTLVGSNHGSEILAIRNTSYLTASKSRTAEKSRA